MPGGIGETLDVTAGLVLAGLGVIVWLRRPASRTGALVCATAACWLAGDVTSAAVFWHRGPLVHLVLGHPAGRLRSKPARLVVGLGYATAAAEPVGRNTLVSLTMAAAVVAAAAYELVTSTGPMRPAKTVALAAAVTTAVAFALGPVARLASTHAPGAVLTSYDLLVVATVTLVVADLLRGQWADDVATGLVVDLGAAGGEAGLQERLALALGDPTLEVGYWFPDEELYVDATGRPVTLPAAPDPAQARIATLVNAEGQPLAVLVHDAQVLTDAALLTDIAAAAQFVVANARLQADVRAQVAAVAASRRRLLAAADVERRLLEERLQSGAAHRLANVARLLADAGPPLGALSADVGRARETLHDLSLGLYPRELSCGDLCGALHALTRRLPLRSELDIAEVTVPPTVATAAYFVCAEALTNVAKYAEATAVAVQVRVQDSTLRLVVSDDGRGGADPAEGSGLRGLVDRAETLGGSLTVNSPPELGTTVTLALPFDGEPASPAAGDVGARIPVGARQ